MYEIYMQSGRSSSRYRQKQRVLDKNVEKPPPKTCCLHYHQWYSPVDHQVPGPLFATFLVFFLYCHLHQFFMSLLQESRA